MTLSEPRSGFQESTDVMPAMGVEAGARGEGRREVGGLKQTRKGG